MWLTGEIDADGENGGSPLPAPPHLNACADESSASDSKNKCPGQKCAFLLVVCVSISLKGRSVIIHACVRSSFVKVCLPASLILRKLLFCEYHPSIPSLSLSLSLSLSVCLSLSLCLSVCQSLSLSLSLSLSFSLLTHSLTPPPPPVSLSLPQHYSFSLHEPDRL